MPLLACALFFQFDVAPAQILEGLLVIPNIRELGNNPSKPLCSRPIMFRLEIELSDVKFMGDDVAGCPQQVFVCLFGIGIIGKLSFEPLENVYGVFGCFLIPIDGFHLMDIADALLKNDVRGRFVSGMKGFEAFVCRNRLVVFLDLVVSIGDLQFRQDGILAEWVPILELLEGFDGSPVFLVGKVFHPFADEFLRGFVLLALEQTATADKKAPDNDKTQQSLHEIYFPMEKDGRCSSGKPSPGAASVIQRDLVTVGF